jgi:hypothetical protein
MGLAENNFVKARMAPSMLAAELPPPETKRWVPRRKAQVVAAVRSGVLSLDEACHRYALTVEEFLSWQRALDRFGLEGLCVTHAQELRTLENRTAR